MTSTSPRPARCEQRRCLQPVAAIEARRRTNGSLDASEAPQLRTAIVLARKGLAHQRIAPSIAGPSPLRLAAPSLAGVAGPPPVVGGRAGGRRLHVTSTSPLPGAARGPARSATAAATARARRAVCAEGGP